MGQLAIVFAALLVGVALIAALAYGPLTASQVSLAPAAAPAPAVAHDHGWSSIRVDDPGDPRPRLEHLDPGADPRRP